MDGGSSGRHLDRCCAVFRTGHRCFSRLISHHNSATWWLELLIKFWSNRRKIPAARLHNGPSGGLHLLGCAACLTFSRRCRLWHRPFIHSTSYVLPKCPRSQKGTALEHIGWVHTRLDAVSGRWIIHVLQPTSAWLAARSTCFRERWSNIAYFHS